MSFSAPPSSPTSSPAPARARTAKSPSPMPRATTASASIGRTTTWRSATASTTAATRIVIRPIMIWRLRCSRTSAMTGSIEVATSMTARTVWSEPWQPWQRSWLGIGW